MIDNWGHDELCLVVSFRDAEADIADQEREFHEARLSERRAFRDAFDRAASRVLREI